MKSKLLVKLADFVQHSDVGAVVVPTVITLVFIFGGAYILHFFV